MVRIYNSKYSNLCTDEEYSLVVKARSISLKMMNFSKTCLFRYDVGMKPSAAAHPVLKNDYKHHGVGCDVTASSTHRLWGLGVLGGCTSQGGL